MAIHTTLVSSTTVISVFLGLPVAKHLTSGSQMLELVEVKWEIGNMVDGRVYKVALAHPEQSYCLKHSSPRPSVKCLLGT